MKTLVLGYGSIGKRHARILHEFLQSEVEVVTRADNCKYKHYSSLAEVRDLQKFDYFIIATDTSRHYQNLVELDALVSNRIILVEKPLFSLANNFASLRNKIYVGYNLRFHPALQKTRELLLGKKISVVNVHVGEYLPWWRPETDYRLCYSAKRDSGGGVVLDLSHEIDYLQWLFGSITRLTSLTGQFSSLEIDSDDYSAIIGITKNKIAINLTMDYLSMVPVRSMVASSSDLTLQLDLEHGLLTTCNNRRDQQTWDYSSIASIDIDFTYKEMHQAIINDDGIDACTLQNGLEIMKTIKSIYSNNLKDKWNAA